MRPVAASDDPVFERPVFIVSPPRSGSTLLFETLARAPAVFSLGTESHRLIETIPALHPAQHGFQSNRLSARDATAPVSMELRARFRAAVRDRDGASAPQQRFRLLEKTPKNALRIPFLQAVFPEACFVYLHRNPLQVLASMIEAWRSGRFKTYTGLPDWPLPYWSLVLTPGWQSLVGKSLPEIVAGQWQSVTEAMLDDLDALPPERRCSLQYDALLADPSAAIAGLCRDLGFGWDLPLDGVLPNSRFTLSPPHHEKWRRHAAVIEPLLPGLAPTIERAARTAG